MRTSSAAAAQHIPQRKNPPIVPDSKGLNQTFKNVVGVSTQSPRVQMPDDAQSEGNFLSGIANAFSFLNLQNAADILIRAPLRVAERTMGPVAGTAFGFASELLRHSTTGALGQAADNRPIDTGVLVKGARRALENTLGRVVLNTNMATVSGNKFKDGAKRALIGLGNMAVRFAFRLGMMALDLVEPGEINTEVIFDEFGGRSFSRIVDANTGNYAVDTAVQAAQQGIIHYVLDRTPLKAMIEQVRGSVSNSPKAALES